MSITGAAPALTQLSNSNPVGTAARLFAFWRVFSRNRLAVFGGLIILIGAITAVMAPLLATYDPYEIDIVHRLMGPSGEHWFGTDYLGRDTYSRVVWGARTAYQVAILAVLLGALMGVPTGAVSGFFGGWVDALIMRLTDALLAFPGRLLAIALVASLGGGFGPLTIAIAVSSIPQYARLLRGVVLSQKEREYVEAARMVGESRFRVLFAEILPNCSASLVVALSLDFAHAILIESTLSFLGLGFPPPTASWGLMLKEVTPFLELQPMAAMFPGAAIALTILGFNMLGDGLRDLFDPRHYTS